MAGFGRVTVTDAALAAIEGLKARHGPLLFCLSEGELMLGPGDVQEGEVTGCPFDVDREQDERWRRPTLVIDVVPGGDDSFSLEGVDGIRLVVGSPGRAS